METTSHTPSCPSPSQSSTISPGFKRKTFACWAFSPVRDTSSFFKSSADTKNRTITIPSISYSVADIPPNSKKLTDFHCQPFPFSLTFFYFRDMVLFQ